MIYGCIAEKLGHSFSGEIHALIDSYDYELREIPRDGLHDFMCSRDFQGINVTIPYKQDVIPYLDEISPTARQIGAVNTICNRGGKLYGYNTDFGGMQALLARMGLRLEEKKVLILGTGGTSRTALAVAKALGAGETLRVSRSAGKSDATYDEVYALHTDAQVILNTTPVGMYPHPDGVPLDLSRFPALCGVTDAIYNPLRSGLVLDAKRRGIPAQGGLYMLISQAILAAELFTGKRYDPLLADRIYQTLRLQKQNLVLIGMPSSGKSTLGKAAARQLGRSFVDLDEQIVLADGRPIPKIFAENGEAYFRDLESKAICDVAQKTGLVIATGGGCVLRESNVRRLQMNGRLLWLDRPLDALTPTDDRPTADSSEKMLALYRQREPIYRAAADGVVPVTGTIEENTARLLAAFTEGTI